MPSNQYVKITLQGEQINKKVKNVITTKNQYGFTYVDCGKWGDYGLNTRSQTIKEWAVQKLWLQHNQEPRILKQIEHIRFPSITQVRLTGNKICSIQSLSCLMMPSLQTLDLTCNKICCILELKKVSFPNLTKLLLNGNLVSECDALQQTKSKNMAEISLDSFIHKDILTEDMTWIMKLEPNNIKLLGMRSQNRIPDQGKKKYITNKYPGIQIFSKN